MLFDLVDHTEYTPLLREEIGKAKASSDWLSHLNELPLLNSFIKESMRLHPADSITLRRKAIETYTFEDGTVIPRGSWACVPLRILQRDPKTYADPQVFNGHRFITASNAQNNRATDVLNKEGLVATQLTDVSNSFLIWGMGRRVCPGRFFATDVLRLIVVTMLENYDLALDMTSRERTWSWKTAIIPKFTVELGMRTKMS